MELYMTTTNAQQDVESFIAATARQTNLNNALLKAINAQNAGMAEALLKLGAETFDFSGESVFDFPKTYQTADSLFEILLSHTDTSKLDSNSYTLTKIYSHAPTAEKFMTAQKYIPLPEMYHSLEAISRQAMNLHIDKDAFIKLMKQATPKMQKAYLGEQSDYVKEHYPDFHQSTQCQNQSPSPIHPPILERAKTTYTEEIAEDYMECLLGCVPPESLAKCNPFEDLHDTLGLKVEL